MNNFPKTTERFIAFFDIMGFKDFIYRNDHTEVSKMMDIVCNVVAGIKNTEHKTIEIDRDSIENPLEKSIILPVVFSDSIVFISESNTTLDAHKIIFTSSYFLCTMMKHSIPVKGAISFGTFTADFEKSSFYGRPLIDAFLLSEEVNFYGSILHDSVEKFVDNENEEWAEWEVIKKLVPMKSGNITHSFVNWMTIIDEDEDKSKDEYIDKFYLTSSGSVRKYVDNTKEAYK